MAFVSTESLGTFTFFIRKIKNWVKEPFLNLFKLEIDVFHSFLRKWPDDDDVTKAQNPIFHLKLGLPKGSRLGTWKSSLCW